MTLSPFLFQSINLFKNTLQMQFIETVIVVFDFFSFNIFNEVPNIGLGGA